MRFPPLLSGSFLLALAGSASAANLAVWDFSALPNPAHETANVAVEDGGALAGAAGLGDGTGVYPGRLEWSAAHSTAAGELNLENWDYDGPAGNPGAAGDGVPDHWIRFDLSAGAGNAVTVTGITLSAWRDSPASPEYYQWDYSLDGGVTWIRFGDSLEETASGLSGGQPVFAPTSFTDSVEAETIRLRFAPFGGTGALHINGITVTGTTVPEPGAAMLLAPLAGLWFLRRSASRAS